MNVVNMETARREDTPNNAVAPSREDALVDALWYGIEHSVHSKDVDHPELPGTLGNFLRHCADISPQYFLSLLAKYMEPPPDK